MRDYCDFVGNVGIDNLRTNNRQQSGKLEKEISHFLFEDAANLLITLSRPCFRL